MNRDKREPEYPAELESQFILRLPEEPSKALREMLKSEENLKNRITIQIEQDMRHGKLYFDHWVMHAKIVDLPTIIESLKTVDNKKFYKTGDISQMMICKFEPDQPCTEEESLTKSKKKDDNEFLWPHGITPPTKNVRKRRFRKSFRKKSAVPLEIEKEVDRLLRLDYEATNFTWEVINEEDLTFKPKPISSTNVKLKKKPKAENESAAPANVLNPEPSNGLEDDIVISFDTNSLQGDLHSKEAILPMEFVSHTSQSPREVHNPKAYAGTSDTITSRHSKHTESVSSELDLDYHSRDMFKENVNFKIEQLKADLEEMKQCRERTKLEIAALENLNLRQRFQDILHALNQEIMYKEMQYQSLITLQNSEDI